jgi:hypothetical protein
MTEPNRRLYRVEATYAYFVIADDEHDALDFGVLRAATNDAIDPNEHIAELDDGRTTPYGWKPECLVYATSDEEITLADARKRFNND